MPSRPALERARAAAGAAALLLAAACGELKLPTEPGPDAGGEAFTFARIQGEVFTPNCAKAGCHVAAVGAGGIVLEAGQSYSQIVDRRALGSPLDRVEPGNPERSYLLRKVRGDADITGARMPFDGPPFLSQEQIDGIAGWIRAGAPQ